jgi:hypothetical protein
MMIDAILSFLGVPLREPTLAMLDALVHAYPRHIPWESVTRIVRRAVVADTAQAPRWPDEFWRLALVQKSGGTCYESNYAFYTLLTRLGFEGYLTINDMNDSIGCHSAIVVTLDNQPYLVDVGLPVHVPIPLNPAHETTRQSWYHQYRAVPDGPARYTISRDRHPNPYCFTLIDRPVPPAEYEHITIRDYEPDGLFLDRAIITKVINDQIWRFNGGETPYMLECFALDSRTYHELGDSAVTVAARLANHFDFPARLIQKAIEASHS